MRLRSIAVALVCASLATCRQDFAPEWKLSGLRIVAITLDPPVVAPGASSRVRVLAVDTENRSRAVLWVACPPTLSAVTRADYRCDSPLAVRGTDDAFDLVAPRIPGGFATIPVTLRVAVCAGGALSLDADAHAVCTGSELRESTRTLRISTREPNANPTVTDVLFDDRSTAPDEPLRVSVCPPNAPRTQCQHKLRVVLGDDAREPYLSGGADGGVSLRERITTHYYATDGTLDNAQNSDPTETVTNDMLTRWSPPPTPGTVTLWLVVQDGRGGTTALERRVVVTM